MRRAAWCQNCNRGFQARSRSQVLCANCATEPDESSDEVPVASAARNDELTNTMAPDAGGVIDDPIARYAAPRREAPSEIACPECRESIKREARGCRFCGADVTERGALERRAERKRERQVDRRTTRRGPSGCPCGGFRASKIPVWAIVVAVLFFPLGLLCLLVREQRCSRCGT